LRVDATYHTEFIRTKNTAEPLAMKLTIPMTQYASGDLTWLDGVLVTQKGKRMLVVGHSGTVEAIVKRLSDVTIPAIRTFDNMVVVVITDAGKKSVVQLKYGKAP